MGHLILYLRQVLHNPAHRVIIFSQWDSVFLGRIGQTLQVINVSEPAVVSHYAA